MLECTRGCQRGRRERSLPCNGLSGGHAGGVLGAGPTLGLRG